MEINDSEDFGYLVKKVKHGAIYVDRDATSYSSEVIVPIAFLIWIFGFVFLFMVSPFIQGGIVWALSFLLCGWLIIPLCDGVLFAKPAYRVILKQGSAEEVEKFVIKTENPDADMAALSQVIAELEAKAIDNSSRWKEDKDEIKRAIAQLRSN